MDRRDFFGGDASGLGLSFSEADILDLSDSDDEIQEAHPFNYHFDPKLKDELSLNIDDEPKISERDEVSSFLYDAEVIDQSSSQNNTKLLTPEESLEWKKPCETDTVHSENFEAECSKSTIANEEVWPTFFKMTLNEIENDIDKRDDNKKDDCRDISQSMTANSSIVANKDIKPNLINMNVKEYSQDPVCVPLDKFCLKKESNTSSITEAIENKPKLPEMLIMALGANEESADSCLLTLPSCSMSTKVNDKDLKLKIMSEKQQIIQSVDPVDKSLSQNEDTVNSTYYIDNVETKLKLPIDIECSFDSILISLAQTPSSIIRTKNNSDLSLDLDKSINPNLITENNVKDNNNPSNVKSTPLISVKDLSTMLDPVQFPEPITPIENVNVINDERIVCTKDEKLSPGNVLSNILTKKKENKKIVDSNANMSIPHGSKSISPIPVDSHRIEFNCIKNISTSTLSHDSGLPTASTSVTELTDRNISPNLLETAKEKTNNKGEHHFISTKHSVSLDSFESESRFRADIGTVSTEIKLSKDAFKLNKGGCNINKSTLLERNSQFIGCTNREKDLVNDKTNMKEKLQVSQKSDSSQFKKFDHKLDLLQNITTSEPNSSCRESSSSSDYIKNKKSIEKNSTLKKQENLQNQSHFPSLFNSISGIAIGVTHFVDYLRTKLTMPISCSIIQNREYIWDGNGPIDISEINEPIEVLLKRDKYIQKFTMKRQVKSLVSFAFQHRYSLRNVSLITGNDNKGETKKRLSLNDTEYNIMVRLCNNELQIKGHISFELQDTSTAIFTNAPAKKQLNTSSKKRCLNRDLKSPPNKSVDCMNVEVPDKMNQYSKKRRLRNSSQSVDIAIPIPVKNLDSKNSYSHKIPSGSVSKNSESTIKDPTSTKGKQTILLKSSLSGRCWAKEKGRNISSIMSESKKLDWKKVFEEVPESGKEDKHSTIRRGNINKSISQHGTTAIKSPSKRLPKDLLAYVTSKTNKTESNSSYSNNDTASVEKLLDFLENGLKERVSIEVNLDGKSSWGSSNILSGRSAFVLKLKLDNTSNIFQMKRQISMVKMHLKRNPKAPINVLHSNKESDTITSMVLMKNKDIVFLYCNTLLSINNYVIFEIKIDKKKIDVPIQHLSCESEKSFENITVESKKIFKNIALKSKKSCKNIALGSKKSSKSITFESQKSSKNINLKNPVVLLHRISTVSIAKYQCIEDSTKVPMRQGIQDDVPVSHDGQPKYNIPQIYVEQNSKKNEVPVISQTSWKSKNNPSSSLIYLKKPVVLLPKLSSFLWNLGNQKDDSAPNTSAKSKIVPEDVKQNQEKKAVGDTLLKIKPELSDIKSELPVLHCKNFSPPYCPTKEEVDTFKEEVDENIQIMELEKDFSEDDNALQIKEADTSDSSSDIEFLEEIHHDNLKTNEIKSESTTQEVFQTKINSSEMDTNKLINHKRPNQSNQTNSGMESVFTELRNSIPSINIQHDTEEKERKYKSKKFDNMSNYKRCSNLEPNGKRDQAPTYTSSRQKESDMSKPGPSRIPSTLDSSSESGDEYNSEPCEFIEPNMSCNSDKDLDKYSSPNYKNYKLTNTSKYSNYDKSKLKKRESHSSIYKREKGKKPNQKYVKNPVIPYVKDLRVEDTPLTNSQIHWINDDHTFHPTVSEILADTVLDSNGHPQGPVTIKNDPMIIKALQQCIVYVISSDGQKI